MMFWQVVSRGLGLISALTLANPLARAGLGVVAIATAVSEVVEGVS